MVPFTTAHFRFAEIEGDERLASDFSCWDRQGGDADRAGKIRRGEPIPAFTTTGRQLEGHDWPLDPTAPRRCRLKFAGRD